MDWTKAKTILIAALIVTNVFLVFTFGFNNPVQTEPASEKVLISVLANNNITLATEVPEKHGKMPVLNIEYRVFNKEKVNQFVHQMKYIAETGNDTEEELIRISNLFLKDNNLYSDYVVLEGVEKQGEGTVVKYKNEIDGILIEESYIYCYFENGKLDSIDSYWLEAKNLGDSKKNTISASEALVIFMSQIEKQEEDIVVNRIELVYWLDTSSFDGEELIKDTALPAWKIVYNENQSEHIYAYEQ
ncbi:MAG: two-component system regulatory protein YycI [Peptostreptococcaceae bacterium]|nr:two-component system regulatory protein YycI [Peptostreptococcaceae bacterium]